VSLGAEKSLEVWEIGFIALEIIVLRSVGEIVSWRSGVSNQSLIDEIIDDPVPGVDLRLLRGIWGLV